MRVARIAALVFRGLPVIVVRLKACMSRTNFNGGGGGEGEC